MKKLLALAVIAVCALPALALAAYNDVTLTTDTVISVGGNTLDVSGSSAAIQSITVNATNFSVTLASGSSLTVSSPTLQQLSSDVTSDVTNNTCTGSASSISLAYSGAGTVTNVITPSATVCSGSGSTPTPAPSGGGGGQIVGSSPTAPGYVNTNPTATSSALVTIAPSASSSTTSTPPGGLSESQIQSILSLLRSFGADDATVASVEAALRGESAPSAAQGGAFTRDLELGITGTDVRALQQYLNAHGFQLANYGPGSPGNETDFFGLATQYQLKQFQSANGLPATGFFGPLTRHAIAQTKAM